MEDKPVVYTKEENIFVEVYLETYDPALAAAAAYRIEHKDLAFLKGRDELKKRHIEEAIKSHITEGLTHENIIMDIYKIVKAGKEVPKGLSQMWNLLCEITGLKKMEMVMKFQREEVSPEDIVAFIKRNQEYLPEKITKKLLDDGHKSNKEKGKK